MDDAGKLARSSKKLKQSFKLNRKENSNTRLLVYLVYTEHDRPNVEFLLHYKRQVNVQDQLLISMLAG